MNTTIGILLASVTLAVASINLPVQSSKNKLGDIKQSYKGQIAQIVFSDRENAIQAQKQKQENNLSYQMHNQFKSQDIKQISKLAQLLQYNKQLLYFLPIVFD